MHFYLVFKWLIFNPSLSLGCVLKAVFLPPSVSPSRSSSPPCADPLFQQIPLSVRPRPLQAYPSGQRPQGMQASPLWFQPKPRGPVPLAAFHAEPLPGWSLDGVGERWDGPDLGHRPSSGPGGAFQPHRIACMPLRGSTGFSRAAVPAPKGGTDSSQAPETSLSDPVVEVSPFPLSVGEMEAQKDCFQKLDQEK